MCLDLNGVSLIVFIPGFTNLNVVGESVGEGEFIIVGGSERVTVLEAVDVKVVKVFGENVGIDVVGGDGNDVWGEYVGFVVVGGDGDGVWGEYVGFVVVGGDGVVGGAGKGSCP